METNFVLFCFHVCFHPSLLTFHWCSQPHYLHIQTIPSYQWFCSRKPTCVCVCVWNSLVEVCSIWAEFVLSLLYICSSYFALYSWISLPQIISASTPFQVSIILLEQPIFYLSTFCSLQFMFIPLSFHYPLPIHLICLYTPGPLWAWVLCVFAIWVKNQH